MRKKFVIKIANINNYLVTHSNCIYTHTHSTALKRLHVRLHMYIGTDIFAFFYLTYV